MSAPKVRASLYDVAPRLALARDQRRWELSVIDEPSIGLRVGDEVAEIIRAGHVEKRCGCGGVLDVHGLTRRLLVGPNRGHVMRDSIRRCRRCGSGGSSHR